MDHPFEGKSISFLVRYGLEGKRSPQNGDICGSRDGNESRTEEIAKRAPSEGSRFRREITIITDALSIQCGKSNNHSSSSI